MSNQDSKSLYPYLCIIPDLPGSKRLEIRAKHFEGAEVLRKAGILVDGGATFAEDKAKNGEAKMTGSWAIFMAEDAEAARKILEHDVYTTGGAWDISKAQITSIGIPFH